MIRPEPLLRLDWRDVQFSVVSLAAALAALYWSMSLDLQQPYWSMLSAYVVSQPLAAAVRSKAVYRLAGTLLGAAMTVLLLPALANTPELLCAAMALWVGACLSISLLDRSPRSYVLMLAGYTAAIVGFSSVNQPGQIFDLAVARAEEISIGILCATLAHSLWFPRSVGEVLEQRIRDWLGEADRWALDLFAADDPSAGVPHRAHLAAAATDIHLLAAHLPFDTSHLRETTAIVRALHDRILLLIPVLSSLSDRLAALHGMRAPVDPPTQDRLTRVGAWIRADCPAAEGRALSAMLAADLDTPTAAPDAASWYALNRNGLTTRLLDLVQIQTECRQLLAHLHEPDAPLAPALRDALSQAGARPLHSDWRLALTSGAVATTAILICCAAWIGLGWSEGGASAMLAAILCCLFASLDDPAPAIRKFGVAICIAVSLAALYQFAVFPAINTFPLLALVLAPPLLAIGAATLNPRLASSALFILLNFYNFMAIQERFAPDLAVFLNNNLSQFFGVFVAIYVTRAARSLSTASSARRLARATWQDLARFAHGDVREPHQNLTARLVDRIGLLAPRLAALRDQDAELADGDVLRELRIGMDLSTLQDAHPPLPGIAQTQVTELLHAVGRHYQQRPDGTARPPQDLCALLDGCIRHLAGPPGQGRALAALVGLRRNLFPDTPYAAGGLNP